MKTSYPLFNGRYTLHVGAKGGLKVYSNLTDKLMKVYGGEGKFCNLIAIKGEQSASYCLKDLLSSCVDGTTPQPLSEKEVNTYLGVIDFYIENIQEYFPRKEVITAFKGIPEGERLHCTVEVEGEEYDTSISRSRANWNKVNGFVKESYTVNIYNSTKKGYSTYQLPWEEGEMLHISDWDSLPLEVIKKIKEKVL